MARLLGIDIGTSGCKALLIDETGKVLKQASAEYPLSTPKPLWSEQNPEDWWTGVQKCLAEIGDQPDAVGLTGQMHGAVFLDSADHVVRPAILWNDQRTAAECHAIDLKVQPHRVRAITGNPPLTGFQLPKILWLRTNEPENFARVRSVLLPKDFIRLRMSGVKATDVSDASGTGAFDINARDWSDELLEAVGVPRSLFPKSFESDEVCAKTESGVPIVAGGGDQAAGACGTGAVAPGVTSVSLGTSGVVFTSLFMPRYDQNGAVHTFCHANRAWHAMGVMLSCGGALRWFRDTLAPGAKYDVLTAEAAEVEPGSEGLTFLPYLTGERTPHNDPNARAVWAGLTLSHTKPHMFRALLEGVTFGLYDGFEVLKSLGAEADELRVTSGGAKSRLWLQMIADVFRLPCVTLESDEGPAFGAALLAGVGIGTFPSLVAACQATIRIKDRIEPRGVDYAEALLRYRSLYPAVKNWNK
ncbi:MAG TPA: xylulokinase [Fimbriimonadaceae bacterium]|nr:xylulokinase [Fimbriimonadaceae bacterium]